MKKLFSWHDVPKHLRIARSKDWFKGFHEFKGRAVCRIDKSTGKPHLYIRLKSGREVCVTWKRNNQFLIHNAYGDLHNVGKLTEKQMLQHLRSLDQ